MRFAIVKDETDAKPYKKIIEPEKDIKKYPLYEMSCKQRVMIKILLKLEETLQQFIDIQENKKHYYTAEILLTEVKK